MTTDLQASYVFITPTQLVILQIFFVLVSGVILLIARRNMKGWDQPIKSVWFSFSGRLNRKAYWLTGFLLLSIVNTGAQLASMLIVALLGMVLGRFSFAVMVIGGFVQLPLFVFEIWTFLAVSVKRVHDRDRSGWWLLALWVPIWNVWVIIQLWFLRGSVGPNRFGPDPLDFYEVDGGEPHVHPRPPQGGEDMAQGFGRRSSQPGMQPGMQTGMSGATTPASSSVPDMPPDAQREPDSKDAFPSNATGNRDIITRRLGNTILRPIQRKPRG